MKKFIAGLVAGILLVSSTPILAQSIEAVFNQIKVSIDGKILEEETLLYNGTTYVPIRAAAEALGKEVNFDEKANIAYIQDAQKPNVDSKVEEQLNTPKNELELPEPVTANESGTYMGSIDSDKFHYPICRFAKKISTENIIWFDSVQEAKEQGYASCGTCKPL